MFKPLTEDKRTFSEKVVDYIQELILSEQLKPGDKLPAERSLAEMMGVSRPTIREAFKLLSAMGFLNVQHGTGVFVSEPSERIDNWASFLFIQSDTIQELFEVRKTLETESASWAASRGSIEYLTQILEKTREVYNTVLDNQFAASDIKEQFLFESDQEFHTMVAKAAGNEVVLRIMNNLIDLLIKSRMQSMKIPGRVELSLKEHIKIAEALVARDAELARKNMYKHLNSVELDLIKELKEQGKNLVNSEVKK